jgi:hypothetical protein
MFKNYALLKNGAAQQPKQAPKNVQSRDKYSAVTAVFTCFEHKIGVGVQGKSNGGDAYETLLDGFTDTRRPGL